MKNMPKPSFAASGCLKRAMLRLMQLSPCLAAGMLLPSPAFAAAPAEGVRTALQAAEPRLDGAELVAIEGFTGPDGDIPCRGRSYSNSWHYKFYSGGDWLIVNACGVNFINASSHRPFQKSGEPRISLPRDFASPAEVLGKMEKDGVFKAEPSRYGRDVQMQISVLPAKSGRPAGCYWFVAQGKAKALADCKAEKTWKLGGSARSGGKGKASSGKFSRGSDTAGRYTQKAINAIAKKDPGAKFMLIEGMVDRTGSVTCISPEDGWSYAFSSPTRAVSTFGGCKGKTKLDLVNFDGSGENNLRFFEELTLPFKDSDFALSKVPKSCRSYRTISMKLRNYKSAYAPFAGHRQVWVVDCGSSRYMVDARTGAYLGKVKK